MAENTKNVEFKNPHPELPVREPILKLGKMVTDRAAIKLGLEKPQQMTLSTGDLQQSVLMRWLRLH